MKINNQIVAVGSGGNSLAYYNGSNWSAINTGMRVGKRIFYDISTTKTYAMGAGANNFAEASTISGAWTPRTISNIAQINAFGIKTGADPAPTTAAGKMVIVGYGNASAVSAVSTNYASSPPTFTFSTNTSASLSSSGMESIAYGNGLYVCGGFVPNTSGFSFAYSTDGISWTGVAGSGLLSTYITRVVYGNGKFLATGGGTAGGSGLFVSTNGTSWSNVVNASITKSGRGLRYFGNNTWYLCGGGTGYKVQKSTDNGVTWTAAETNVSSTLTQVRDIEFANNTYVITGFNTSGTNTGNKIMTSTDGINWTVVSGTSCYYGNTVKHNNGVWLCGCYAATGGTLLFKSTTPTTSWTPIITSSATRMTQVINVCSDGTRWYISGTGATGYQFAYSSNNNPSSINDFTFVSAMDKQGEILITSTTPTSSLYYIAGGIGKNNMQRSSDSINWTSITSPFSLATNDVCWSESQQRWVAMGEGGNTIAYSDDGTIWTGLGTSVFSIRGKNVVFDVSANKWYATGEGTNTMMTSTNGINWV